MVCITCYCYFYYYRYCQFRTSFISDAWKTYVPLGIGFLNLSAGLITTISQFLRVSELLEGHRAASLAYSKFSRNISVEQVFLLRKNCKWF